MPSKQIPLPNYKIFIHNKDNFLKGNQIFKFQKLYDE